MLRYSVRITHIHDGLPISYACFKTINQLVKYCDTFDITQVMFDASDDVFGKNIDIDELLEIWRSN